ncbi:type II secretion system protein N [Burkholderia lata]|uniref:type II secretion system protein N n=1 Tax=Burkholderia lata (strain ATCC 17760 / DSM 23089 / LMG 22485 / NCIMB 9086 / R18194 / 383) TaxID=482957 RepID=UPI00145469F3|nr:type II secretion system protein N [Burkholderia lata]VWC00424.1 type II secretion system protein N [Burkholderia lata]
MRPGIKRLATALPWVLAGGLATAVTLVALAPAAWIAPQFARATGGHVNLVDPDGSLWHGSGTLMLAPGADQSAATLLPGRVEWTTGFWPLLTGRVQMRMRQTEAMPDAVTLDATWRGAVLSAGTMAVPASLLAGLGTPFNTLDLQGDVRLGWSDWRLIGNNAFGQLTVTIDSMSSRVSRVKPLGSYRAVLQAKGAGADLDLSTMQGPLFLDGHGNFGPGQGAFRGTAHSAPEQQANLAGLLNLLGHPLGNNEVSLIFGDAQR